MIIRERIKTLNKTIAELKTALAQVDDASPLVDDLNYAADHFDLSVRLFEDALGKARARVAGETIETILEAQAEIEESLIAEEFQKGA
jgi:hypothetical protein